jgi:CheY-like chemotaxis protein/anti-sigma regulatory factor (Ser/Thr protein kinase)
MTSILGYSQLLLEESLLPKERNGFVDTIRKNGEHLLGLINEVLDLSKIESGKFTLQKEYCLTGKFFEDVVSSLKIPAQEKKNCLEMLFKSDLPKVIYVDTLRLRQSLLNLVGNAIKFTHEGKVSVEVTMQEAKDRWRLVVVVTDTGIGIPPEMLEAVFRPFSQVDSSFSRKYGGTGLGLTITQKIAEAMGGTLLVESKEDKGSKFTFDVFVDRMDTARITQIEDGGGESSETFHGKISGVVLLAEDGRDNQRLLTHILERAGATVELAENGKEVLEKLALKSYGLVLMDVQMPIMDGLQTAAEIRRRKNSIPIIAVTAYAMQRDEGMCLKAGCDDFISKPIDSNLLLEKVAKWLKAGRSMHAC